MPKLSRDYLLTYPSYHGTRFQKAPSPQEALGGVAKGLLLNHPAPLLNSHLAKTLYLFPTTPRKRHHNASRNP